MALTLAELWLSTGGHGVYEHLGTTPVRPGRRIPQPRAMASPRAEDLLCGCLAFYGAECREGATLAGLKTSDLTTAKARAMWDGSPSPTYRAYVMAEYDWAADELLRQWCERRVAGLEADLYGASAAEIAEALAGHIVRLAQVRDKLIEAERLLQGAVPTQRRQRSGVAV
jgi:hypothetical protein